MKSVIDFSKDIPQKTTNPSAKGWSTIIVMSVCLYVCLSLFGYEYSKSTIFHPIFTKLCMMLNAMYVEMNPLK